jgi:hypothetical protein
MLGLQVYPTMPDFFYMCLFLLFCGTGVRTQAQGLMLARKALSHLSHSTHQPFFVIFFFFSRDRVSRIMCLGLALNYDPPDLCLLSRITCRSHRRLAFVCLNEGILFYTEVILCLIFSSKSFTVLLFILNFPIHL